MVTTLNDIGRALCHSIIGSCDAFDELDGTCKGDICPRFLEAAKIALAAAKNPSDKALLAPGEPYQVAAKVLVSRERGIELRRQAWNKIIDAILKGD